MTSGFTNKDTNAVKGLAVLTLLLYHLRALVYDGVVAPPFEINAFVFITDLGFLCVPIFAFLSAYGLTKTFQRTFSEQSADCVGATSFCLRRVFTLWSKFFCVYVVVFLFFAVLQNGIPVVYRGDFGHTVTYILLDALGLNSIYGTPTLCHAWWYMVTAYLAILLTPLCAHLAKATGIGSFVALVILITCYAPEGSSIQQLSPILMGCAAAHSGILDKQTHKGLRLTVSLVALLLLLYMRGILGYLPITGALLPLVISAVFVYGLRWASPLYTALSWLGSLSADVYFVHLVLQESLLMGAYAKLNDFWLDMLLTATFSFAFALFMHKVKALIGFDKLSRRFLEKLTPTT